MINCVTFLLAESYSTTMNYFTPLGGSQVVSMLAFYCDDPSSNPTEAFSFIL